MTAARTTARTKTKPLTKRPTVMLDDRSAADTLTHFWHDVVEEVSGPRATEFLAMTRDYRAALAAEYRRHAPDWLNGVSGKPPRPHWLGPTCQVLGQFCMLRGYDRPELLLAAYGFRVGV